LTKSLPTPTKSVQKLQTSLHAKAKAEPATRFYALWDKVYRNDVIEEAYRRCRENDGTAGVDGITFEKIETEGRKQWLEMIGQELRDGSYRPQPLLRVWIPKRTYWTTSTASDRRGTPRWLYAGRFGTSREAEGETWWTQICETTSRLFRIHHL